MTDTEQINPTLFMWSAYDRAEAERKMRVGRMIVKVQASKRALDQTYNRLTFPTGQSDSVVEVEPVSPMPVADRYRFPSPPTRPMIPSPPLGGMVDYTPTPPCEDRR